jgi:drug/metabolite transporter (DMT)-like permease
MEASIYKVLIFAGLAAIGNAVYVFGQRSAVVSSNPFLFMAGAITLCAIMFLTASLLSGTGTTTDYLKQNWWPIVISAIGFFITFIGFYLMYSRVGAHSYTVYAVLSVLTTSVGVGMIIFREPFNFYHVISICFALLAVCFYGYGQFKILN